jgi:DNA polymerase I
MEVEFQLLDSDYILSDGVVVRLFGRTKEGKSVCAFFKGYDPYFYVEPQGNAKEIQEFLVRKFNKLIKGVEQVEKFKSIGYTTEKTKMLKIFLTDPSQTPLVRDELLRSGIVKEIFEADILFKYRFMADHGIYGMRWLKVIGKPTRTDTVKADIKIDAEKFEQAEDQLPNLKYMSIDIETLSETEDVPNPKNDKIIMIALNFFPKFNDKKSIVLVAKKFKDGNSGVTTFRTEKEMLEELGKIIDSYDPDVITGYNINDFDLPFLLGRMTENKVSKIIGRCKQKQAMSKKLGLRHKNDVIGRIIVDVYELIKESIGKGLLRLKRYGLGDVSRELLKEEKLDVAYKDIPRYWGEEGENFNKLIEYARKDSELALRLLIDRNMLDKFVEISKVCGLLLQDVLDGGEAPRVENLLLREFNKEDYVIPLRPSDSEVLKRVDERETKGLKGALVLEPITGLHTTCVIYLDFKSMYPSIFIAYNICPTTLTTQSGNNIKTPYGTEFVKKNVKLGIIPKIVESLIKERDSIKGQMAKTSGDEKRLIEAKQIALKYMTNSFYGYTGYVRARMYLLDIANAITSCGRELIQKTKYVVEETKEYTVIYGDTDSIMVKTNTSDLDEAGVIGKSIERKINETFKGTIEMKIESVFKTLLITGKKRYAGLSFEKTDGTWDENIVMKGIETVRRDWCNLTSDTLLKVLEIILKEQNPKKALEYTRDILRKLERNEIPIEDLVITKGISKSLKEYKGIQPHIELVKKMRKRSSATAPSLGDRVGFIIIQGTQILSERAEDPEYARQHGMKIDSKYYIESQILPPLERVLDIIGISKDEIFGRGKQKMLSDILKISNNGRQMIEALHTAEGVTCVKCSQNYRRPPLSGRCNCGGELLFYLGNQISKTLAI